MSSERSNEEWVTLLPQSGPETEPLFGASPLPHAGLQSTLQGRPTALELVEDFAQDSILHITRNLGQFRGGSRFTTGRLR
jgi:hypothetical protein